MKKLKKNIQNIKKIQKGGKIMASLNKVMLLGNLGKDPEIKKTQNGNEFANLTLATSESWKDKQSGEKKEKTEWHRIVVWNEGQSKF